MMGDPVTFYCTRCGKQLQIGHELAGQRVRCGHCSNVVGSPEPETDIPVAFVVEQEEPDAMLDDEAVASLLGLEAALNGLESELKAEPTSHSPLPAVKLPVGLTVDGLAEQLERVEEPVTGEASAMTECPHCGSTIAAFVGRCPYCRHPLRGS